MKVKRFHTGTSVNCDCKNQLQHQHNDAPYNAFCFRQLSLSFWVLTLCRFQNIKALVVGVALQPPSTPENGGELRSTPRAVCLLGIASLESEMGIQTLVSTCINQKIKRTETERNIFVLHSQKRHLSLPSPNIIGDHFKTITRSILKKILKH